MRHSSVATGGGGCSLIAVCKKNRADGSVSPGGVLVSVYLLCVWLVRGWRADFCGEMLTFVRKSWIFWVE